MCYTLFGSQWSLKTLERNAAERRHLIFQLSAIKSATFFLQCCCWGLTANQKVQAMAEPGSGKTASREASPPPVMARRTRSSSKDSAPRRQYTEDGLSDEPRGTATMPDVRSGGGGRECDSRLLLFALLPPFSSFHFCLPFPSLFLLFLGAAGIRRRELREQRTAKEP